MEPFEFQGSFGARMGFVVCEGLGDKGLKVERGGWRLETLKKILEKLTGEIGWG